MIKRIFTGTLILFLSIFTFAVEGNADLLSAFPVSNDQPSLSMRITDVSKTISGLFPEKLFAALNVMSADLGSDAGEWVKLGTVIHVLKDSNVRDFAFMGALDGSDTVGCIATIANAEDFFKKAADSGTFSLLDFVSVAGGQKLVDAMVLVCGENSLDVTFKRDSDGIFTHKNDYVMFEGNSVISFLKKQDILAVAEQMKKDEGGMSAQLKTDDIFIINIVDNSKDEPIRIELGISNSDGVFKCEGISNSFTVYPEFKDKFSAKNFDTPIVGKGNPFYAAGGNSILNGVSDIEDILMLAGDTESTAVWANIIGLAQSFSVTKDDIGNMLSGAMAFVVGVDEKIMDYDVPLGGYFVMTGKGGAAAKIVKAVFDAMAESALITENKIDGWDKVYTITNEFGVPNVIAQKGESLLVGMIAPETLNHPLSLEGEEVHQLTGWVSINFERIWEAAIAIFDIRTAFNSLLGINGDETYQFDAAVTRLLNSPIPLSSIGIWIDSPEKFKLDITTNPSSTPEFWLNLFEVFKLVN